MSEKKPTSGVHLIRRGKPAEDTKLVTSDPLIMEDEFSGLYQTSKNNSNVVVEPPFNPMVLASLITRNNILAQCVEAMEVNIDGSGQSFVLLDAEQDKTTGDTPSKVDQTTPTTASQTDTNDSDVVAKADRGGSGKKKLDKKSGKGAKKKKKRKGSKKAVVDPEKEMLEHFFAEPYPGQSFTTIRRKLRVDLEATGNAYLEVIRNVAGDIVFLRHLESVLMRLVRLDAPVDVEVSITRNGEDFTAVMPIRERRFVYKVGSNLTYYRAFGTSRQINRTNGDWIEKGAPDAVGALLGSEIIHFTVHKDFRTHYGIPRWINQLPSVLGSRKAEEYNLEFFDSGGLPPAIIFVQGGQVVGGVSNQLEQFISGAPNKKHRAAVVEVMSTSGSLDSGGSVQVKVERFGSSMTDFMFQKYDDQTKEHVRTSFRIPPILVGISQDYNLATSLASLKAAENQVFQPERAEFDEIINTTVVKALGAKRYRMVSNSVSFADAEIQLSAMQYAQNRLGGKELIDAINRITGLNLTYREEDDPVAQAQAQSQGAPADGAEGQEVPPPGSEDTPAATGAGGSSETGDSNMLGFNQRQPVFGEAQLGAPLPHGSNLVGSP